MARRKNTEARTRITFAICLSIALFSAAVFPQNARAQNESSIVGIRAYEANLQRYSSLIEQNKRNPSEIAAIRKSLPAEWTVENNGTQFRVSTDSLDSALTELQTRPNNADQVARDIEFRLAEMRQSAIDMESAPVAASLSSAQADAREILQRGEFRTTKAPSALQKMEERIASAIGRWIGRLLSRLHIGAKTGNALAWTIIALGFLAIGYWIYRTLSQRESRAELPVSSAEIVSDAREWVGEALSAAERGDYREAVRCAYWAAIARLEDIKLLKRDRARTPRESLRLLDSHPSVQTSLRNLTSHFELIWYGYRPASLADWSETKTLLEKFGCLAGSTAPTANS